MILVDYYESISYRMWKKKEQISGLGWSFMYKRILYIAKFVAIGSIY